MQISDITDQIRIHLLDGETMTEEPSDYFGDRMLTIATRGVPVRAYIVGDMYALAASDIIEAWRPGDRHASQTINIVLDYARHGGKTASSFPTDDARAPHDPDTGSPNNR